MEAYGGMEVRLRSFLSSALNGNELYVVPASSPVLIEKKLAISTSGTGVF
jgi:hypothetical protein